MKYDYTVTKRAIQGLFNATTTEDPVEAANLEKFSKSFARNFGASLLTILQDIKDIPPSDITNEQGKLSAKLFLQCLKNGKYKYSHIGEDTEVLMLTLKAFCAVGPGRGLKTKTRKEYFTSLINRSTLVKSQNSGDGLSYSVGVPVVPYIYRKYHDIPYSAWDMSEPEFKKIIGPVLAEVLDYVQEEEPVENWLSLTELQEFYPLCLYANNSPHNLKMVSLSLPKASSFNNIPKVMRMMLLQRWIFTRENDSNPYLVRNPYDWDSPTALYDLQSGAIEELVKPVKETFVKPSVNDLPWD